jgi:acyl-CoA hydrolase
MITEYGAVNLHGMTLRERGNALISIAHPDFRADLARALGAIRRFAVPGFD